MITRFIFHPEMLKIEYSKMISIRIHFTYIQTRGLWIYYNCVNQWKVFCAVLLQIASLIKLTKNNLLCMTSCITLRPTAYKREYFAFSIRKSLKMLQGKWRANPIFLCWKYFCRHVWFSRKHVTVTNIISIPLTPHFSTLCYCFSFAKISCIKPTWS